MLNNFIKKTSLKPLFFYLWVILKHNEIIFLVACLVVQKIISHKLSFFFKIFLMWTILLNLLQYCFCLSVLVFWPQGMWDLNSLTELNHGPYTGRWRFNHWTTRESHKLSDLIFITKWVVCFVILICTLRIVEAKELKYFTKYYTVDKFVLLLMLSHWVVFSYLQPQGL